MEEIWKQTIIEGKINPWYSISNFGNLVSHKRITREKGKFVSTYDPNYKKPVVFTADKKGYMYKKLLYPGKFFDNHEYFSDKKGNHLKNVYAHQLVMWAFKPMDDYPPIPMEDWISSAETARQFIKRSAFINHINHNHQDNSVDNLEYTEPRDNSLKALSHYGGHHANKKNAHTPMEEEKIENSLLNFYS